MVKKFPPVEMADDSGLLAVGGDLEVPTLELAYRSGIFPWPVSRQPLLWFAPPHRAILEFDHLKISQRLERYFKTLKFELRINSNFESVIRACARCSERKGRESTWITDQIVEAYVNFHYAGFAHCFETFRENRLVGGLYGVRIGHYFAGESMFYTESHASKFALVKAVDHLARAGLTWMDVQVQSPFLKTLGVTEIPRPQFMQRLREAVR